jgi:hypothetical protein
MPDRNALRHEIKHEIKNERFVLMAKRGREPRRWGSEIRFAVLLVGAFVAWIFVMSAWQLLDSGLPRIGGELKIGSWITVLVALTSTAYVLYYLGGAAIGISRANAYSRRLSQILSEVETFEEKIVEFAARYEIPLAASYDVMENQRSSQFIDDIEHLING